MAAENQLCAMCFRKTPSLYCLCAGFRVNLCEECIVPHMRKFSQLRHAMLPIEISVAGSAAYFQEMERFAAGKTELEQIPTKIDQRCYELIEAVDSVVAKLISYRDECVRQLQAWKASLSTEIAEAVGEVQAALSGRKVDFRSRFSHLLKNFKSGSFDLLSSLVDSELRHSQGVREGWESLCRHLKQFRSREIYRAKEARKVVPTDPSRIVYVDEETVQEFTRTENGLPQRRQLYWFSRNGPSADWGSSCTLLDAERLISCGSHAYIVFLNEDQFVQLPDMNYPRGYPGIVKHEDYVFVFGSCFSAQGFQTSGEFLPLSPKKPKASRLSWTLASGVMSAQRYHFTPCVMNNFIYLCGGYSKTIDLFDITRKAFAGCAGVELPEASGCIAFMRGSAELVVISNTKVSVFPILNGVLLQGEPKDHRQLSVQPKSTPVLIPGDGLSIYFVNNIEGEGMCVRLILKADNSVQAIDCSA